MKKLENVLITGVTGSGKSVWVKSMMADIMKALSPEDVKFIVYDAKCVEFVHLKESRYWLKPVMTEAGEFARALEWLKVEVEKRFQMFRVAGVDGIEAFNARRSRAADSLPEHLAEIVLVVDELSDAMIDFDGDGNSLNLADVVPHAREDVERLLVFLLTEGHGAGVRLILVTSRPAQEVFTDKLLAVVPTRVVFKVASEEDSIRLLGQRGARDLQRKGEYLLRAANGVVGVGPVRSISDCEFDRLVSARPTGGV